MSRHAFTRSTSRLRRDLRLILVDGSAYNLMVGIGESYLIAFALAMGLGDAVAGLLMTVPVLVGGILQMISPWGVQRFGSYRRWVAAGAAVQAASLLPFLLAAMLGQLSCSIAFATTALYWGAGLATIPAWNSWVSELIPDRIRARYFSQRSRFTQTSVLGGFLMGGLLLHQSSGMDVSMEAFSLMFLVAFVARSYSATLLARQSEPHGLVEKLEVLSLRQSFRRLTAGRDARLLVLMLGMQFSVSISGAYFTPFMLRQLQFTYFEFVLVTATAFLIRMMAMPILGEWARRIGSERLLWVGSIAVIPLAALWLLADSFWQLILVQAYAGVAWAALELAMILVQLQAVPQRERLSVLTLFHLIHATATAGGALLGGALLAWGGSSREAYYVVFGLSSLARLTIVASVALWTLLARDESLTSASTTAKATPSSAYPPPRAA